jgi:hypothetical protein
MKLLESFLLILLIPSLISVAQTQPPSQGPREAFSFANGNKVLQLCESEDPADGMWCAGYMSAAASAAQSDWLLKDSNVRICLPSSVNLKQLTDMAVKYLKAHPEHRHYDAFAMVVVSWSSFTCSTDVK